MSRTPRSGTPPDGSTPASATALSSAVGSGSSSSISFSFTPQPYAGISTPPRSSKMSNGYGYDVEAGSTGSKLSGSVALIRRLVARRSRLLLGVVGLTVVGLFLYDAGSEGGAGDRFRFGSFGGYSGAGKGKEHSSPIIDENDFIIDEYGDHFYPHYPQLHIPSFDPDISLLTSPDDLFANIDLETHFLLPEVRIYPDSLMRKVHSPPKTKAEEEKLYTVPDDAYSKSWTPPEGWNEGGQEMKRVQWEGFDRRYETMKEREVREKRREAVRRGFGHAWQAYKEKAWGECDSTCGGKVNRDGHGREDHTPWQSGM